MKKVFIIFLIFVCLSSYGQTNKDYKNTNKVSKDIFTGNSNIAIINYDSLNEIYKYIVYDKAKGTSLFKTEISDVNKILKDCINEYNKNGKLGRKQYNKMHKEDKMRNKDYVIRLRRYKRQYIAVINDKGEKELYINCLCNVDERNWRKNLCITMDGGNCYFHLKINLKTKKYYEFSVNGCA